MPLETVLVIVLMLLLLGVLPVYPWSRSWGLWPSGGVTLLLLILLIVALVRP
jgi:hypothetical protein